MTKKLKSTWLRGLLETPVRFCMVSKYLACKWCHNKNTKLSKPLWLIRSEMFCSCRSSTSSTGESLHPCRTWSRSLDQRTDRPFRHTPPCFNGFIFLSPLFLSVTFATSDFQSQLLQPVPLSFHSCLYCTFPFIPSVVYFTVFLPAFFVTLVHLK